MLFSNIQNITASPKPSLFHSWKPVLKSSFSNAICAGLAMASCSSAATILGRLLLQIRPLAEEEISTYAAAAAVAAGALAVLQEKKPFGTMMITGITAGLAGMFLAPKVQYVTAVVGASALKVIAAGAIIGTVAQIPINVRTAKLDPLLVGSLLGGATTLGLSTSALGTIAIASLVSGITSGLFSLYFH